jgi:hypothetical protein
LSRGTSPRLSNSGMKRTTRLPVPKIVRAKTVDVKPGWGRGLRKDLGWMGVSQLSPDTGRKRSLVLGGRPMLPDCILEARWRQAGTQPRSARHPGASHSSPLVRCPSYFPGKVLRSRGAFCPNRWVKGLTSRELTDRERGRRLFGDVSWGCYPAR